MRSPTKPVRRASIILASGAAFALLVATAGSALAATAPGLGTADSFAVLAGAGVTNTNASTIGGNLGAANGSVSGDTSLVFTSGTNHYGDGLTTGAMVDLEAAFGTTRGQGTDVTVSADLGGQTLTPGVYFQAEVMNLSGPVPLVLDAGGNADAVWIFNAGSLIVGPGASVSLIGGASACNVFWTVGSSASLNDGAFLIGTVMARTSITLASAASVQGRVLALDGNVTLIGNTISRPACAAAIPETGGTTTGTTETGPQVAAVPSGGVATGDGSTSQGSFDFLLAVGVVAIAGAASVVVRRNRLRIA